MTEQHVDIVIIGAGLTGLTLAHYLKKAGKHIKVIEKEGRVGGVIKTYEEKGFIFESGPNTGVIGFPEVAELFEELTDQCSLEIANPKAKNRWIWKKGKWNPLPSGPVSAISTPLFTFKDKIRILGEPFRKKGNDPLESVAEMVERRLGKSFLKYAVDPFISGIYAGDPSNLITKYALPKLYALEQNYGSFIKGSIKKKKETKSDRDKKATREIFSAKGGLNQLINALEHSVGKDNFVLNADKISVSIEGDCFSINITTKDSNTLNVISAKVISTIGGYAIPEVFPFLSKEKIEPIFNLEYAKVVQVILGYKKWNSIPLNAFGGLVPSIEERSILGVLFTSSFFVNRCPDGGAILSVFLGGTKRPDLIDLNNEEIKSVVFKEVNEMLKLENEQPDILHIFRYQKAIPQYGESSPERIQCIEKIENEFPGLTLAGNIRNGIGMADRIKQATDIASKIIDENS